MATQSLPTPGGSAGTWGTTLNAYLRVSLDAKGQLNTWTTSTRPTTPSNGTTGINTTTNTIESYNETNSTWETKLTAASGGGGTTTFSGQAPYEVRTSATDVLDTKYFVEYRNLGSDTVQTLPNPTTNNRGVVNYLSRLDPSNRLIIRPYPGKIINNQPAFNPDQYTVAGVTGNSITVNVNSLTTNQYAGNIIEVVSATTGVRQRRNVVSNTSSTLTVDSNWITAITNSDPVIVFTPVAERYSSYELADAYNSAMVIIGDATTAPHYRVIPIFTNAPKVMYLGEQSAFPVTNTLTETTILPNSLSSTPTITAKSYRLGRTYKLRIGGFYSCAAGASFIPRFKILASGGNLGISPGPVTMASARSNSPFLVEVFASVRKLNDSSLGTMDVSGVIELWISTTTSIRVPIAATTAINLDMNNPGTPDFTIEWTGLDANNSFAGNSCIFEVLDL